MGLLLLLLLHLHLGNAPWTEGVEEVRGLNEVSASIPAPYNVSISSLNMEHTLSFLPGPDTPSGTHFTVEVLCLSSFKNLWRAAAGCMKLTAGQTCNLTQAFKDPYDHYRARIQAIRHNQTSSWIMSGWFQPLSDTVLGPPDVSMSGCGNCLLLKLRPPTVRGQPLPSLHRDLLLDVQRTWDGAQFRLTLHYKDEIVITYLQPGVEYCVTVSLNTVFNSNADASKPYCAFTSPPLPTSSLHVVYGLLSVFCVLCCLLIGLAVCDGQLGLKLVKQRLLRALGTTGEGSKSCMQTPAQEEKSEDH